MASRRGARKLALDILYEHDLREASIASVLDRYSSNPAFEFASSLVLGVAGHLAELDGLIDKHSEEWSTKRMAPIDRNLLRLGMFELLYQGDVPAAVSINEVVELAKIYSTSESSRFINGILGKVARELV